MQQPRSKPKESEGGAAGEGGSTIEGKTDNIESSTSEEQEERGEAASTCTNDDDRESNKKSSKSDSAQDPEPKKPRLSFPEMEKTDLVIAS